MREDKYKGLIKLEALGLRDLWNGSCFRSYEWMPSAALVGASDALELAGGSRYARLHIPCLRPSDMLREHRTLSSINILRTS